MSRRSIGLIVILLLCFSAVSCRKSQNEDPLLVNEEEGQIVDNQYGNLPREAASDGSKETVEEIIIYEVTENNPDMEPEEVSASNNIEDKFLKEETSLTNKLISLVDLRAAFSDLDLKDVLNAYPAGTVLNIDGIEAAELEELFYMQELNDEIKVRMNGKSYGEDCTIPYEDLSYIRVLHKGFDGETYIGELIVNKKIALDITEIFQELYNLDYPIERMVLIDEYQADDVMSMEDNNSSAFNFRFIAGTKRLSRHSNGSAIDINPLYNPYITYPNGKENVSPENAKDYADRSTDNSYYIRKNDPCYQAFISRGFTWGGEWENSKDYQHFQKEIED